MAEAENMLAPHVNARDFAAEALPPFERYGVPSRYRPRAHFAKGGSLVEQIPSSPNSLSNKRTSVGSVASYRSDGSTVVTTFSNNTSRRSSFTSLGSAPPLPAHPSLIKTQWETQRSKQIASAYHIGKSGKASLRSSGMVRRASYQFPRKYFAKLPKEVYECIVKQVELEYFDTEEGGCVSCYLQQMYNICLVSRPWLVAATRRMFKRIWLPVDECWEDKPHKGNFVSRLKTLRKLLRQRPPIAKLVKDIRIPGLQQLYDSVSIPEQEEILNELATIVMVCPSLEQFSGLLIQYDHNFDRLTHALASRTNLRERIWHFRRADTTYDEYGHETFARKALAGWNVDFPDAFLNSHQHLNYLSTLMLFGSGVGSMDYRAFGASFRSMPMLQTLVIANFDAVEFNDRTLATLPQALSKLRLENLPGVTQKGIDKFIKSETASWINTLTFINVPITTVVTLQGIFNLPELENFSISQRNAPPIPEEFNMFAVGVDTVVTPHAAPALFTSPKLKYLHWDMHSISTINGYLSDSITRPNGFPALRKLRCPNDHDGLLQAVCKPTGDLLNSSDASIANIFGEIREGKHVGSMTKARHRAQYWINQARREPRLKILVHDETGTVKRRFIVGGYVGRADSNVEFCLEPDIPGQEEAFANFDEWRNQGVIKPPPTLALPALEHSSMQFPPPSSKADKHSSRRSIMSSSSSIVSGLASPPMSPTVPSSRQSLLSQMMSRPATRTGSSYSLSLASAKAFELEAAMGPPACMEQGWCTGPGWGDIQPGMEGKKGSTHPRRRMVRLTKSSQFF